MRARSDLGGRHAAGVVGRRSPARERWCAERCLLRARVRRSALCVLSLLLLLQRHTRALPTTRAREIRSRERRVREHALCGFRDALPLRACVARVQLVRLARTVLSRAFVRAIVRVCVRVLVRMRVRFPGARAVSLSRRVLIRVWLSGPRACAHHA